MSDTWPPPGVEFGCEFCAYQTQFHQGGVEQIGTDVERNRILIRCPRCGALYENTPTGSDEIRRLTQNQADELFPEHE